jgi:mannose-6-phosphate isomerase-like protein (cupin superfamily)
MSHADKLLNGWRSARQSCWKSRYANPSAGKRRFRKVNRIMSNETSAASTSGKLSFEYSYSFSEGGPVESGTLPFPHYAPAPFEVARWSVAPGKANDLDTHVSREVWLVISGEGRLKWRDQSTTIRAGDAVAFDTKVPHQVHNTGSEPLRVFSVYWKQADFGPVSQ